MIKLPCYCNEEPSRHHGPCDEEEDEEVDVDANGEDEEDGEQRERNDDLPHHSGGFWPLPPFKRCFLAMFVSWNIFQSNCPT